MTAALFLAPASNARAESAAFLKKTKQDLYRLLEAYRSAEGLPRLRRSKTLADAALGYAVFLAKRCKHRVGCIGHRVDGSSPYQRIKRRGYKLCAYAENVAFHYDPRGVRLSKLAALIHKGWRGSKAHNRNLRSKSVAEVGIGIAQTPGERTFHVVQKFARRCKKR